MFFTKIIFFLFFCRASGSSDEEEIECDVTTQSSEEEEEEEELMEEMTNGPSVEPSETADDLSVRRQTPQDLSLMKVKETKDGSKEEAIKISENSVSTTSPVENSPKTRESQDARKSSPKTSRLENSFPATDFNHKHLSSGNITPSNRLNYNFFQNSEEVDTPVRLRSNGDHVDVSKAHRGLPKELKLRESGRGVWAKEKIPRGTKYGPFIGKWVSDPVDSRFAWEVSFFFFFFKLPFNTCPLWLLFDLKIIESAIFICKTYIILNFFFLFLKSKNQFFFKSIFTFPGFRYSKV